MPALSKPRCPLERSKRVSRNPQRRSFFLNWPCLNITSLTLKKRPSNWGLSCVQSALRRRICSFIISPCPLKLAFNVENSSSIHPTPRLRIILPFDRTSNEATCFANHTGLRMDKTIIEVPNFTCSVRAAAYPSVTKLSRMIP